MSLIETLEHRLQLSLPGKDAHAKMTHLGRFPNPTIPSEHKKASVLILLYQKSTDWHTVLMKRTSRFKNDKHKGQISFPGGQAETFDINKAATAVRETEEEVGIPGTNIKVLGGLSQLYIPVSNFLVHPFVGYVPEEPNFSLDSDEVDEIIETPLSLLMDGAIQQETTIDLPNGFQLKNVPYFDVHGHVVWGATSMIISEFITVLDDVGFSTRMPKI